MKGMFLDDSMSNLTSASNEASLSSSSNKNEVGTTMYPTSQHMQQQSIASVPVNSNIQTQTNKKKRNLPGNPDPDAEVISMSPKSLMATNRFVCEICSKGFQRDQNLQLHRRGHNLPWKLKQRSKLEVVKKKVYVCPEPSCVHHEPARALGDLTGIKKHFSRKHGEKKWKCDKCSKRYAVQSDWKAHSKICGTREYRCDCGTLFSRRDSFITHRAFCSALTGENARSSSSLISPNHFPHHFPINFPLKTEPQHFMQHSQLNSNIMTNTLHQNHQLPSWFGYHQQNPSPNNGSNNNNNLDHLPSPSSPPHMSATALLQKAAQMGVTMSKPAMVMSQQQQQNHHQSILSGPHHNNHMCVPSTMLTAQHHAAGLGNLSSSDDGQQHQQGMLGLSDGFANATTTTAMPMHAHPHQLLYTNSMACTSAGSTAFEDAYNGMLNSTKSISNGFQEAFFPQRGGGGGGGNDELTRDFLGLTGFPPTADHHHFLSMTGLDDLSTSSPYHYHQQSQQKNSNQNQNQEPWPE